MSRKIGISEPMVLTQHLKALQNMHFDVLDNGEPYSQWYYQNSEIYYPDRQFDNLVLRPVFQATLPENGETVSYEGGDILLSYFKWEWLEHTLQGDVWHNILPEEQVVIGEVDYYTSGSSLVIRKNVRPDEGAQIRGTFKFVDPRDSTFFYTEQKSISLNSSQDSDVVFPSLAVKVPLSQQFNPITDGGDTVFHIPAKAMWAGADISDLVEFVWFGMDKDLSTEEVPIENIVAYIEAPETMVLSPESGGSTDPQNPTIIYNTCKGTYENDEHDVVLVDAMYAEKLTVVCRARFKYTIVTPLSGDDPSSEGWYERTVSLVTATTGNPAESGWYESLEGLYIHSKDTTVLPNKAYYIITYTATSDTEVNPSKSYWTTEGALFPDRIGVSIRWEDFKMESQAVCGGGNAVSSDDDDIKVFNTITTIRQGTISEEQKQKHLLYHWKKRASNVGDSQAVYCGWGTNCVLRKDALVGSQYWINMNVSADVFLQGALRPVTYSDDPVTYNGEVIYSRT